MIAIFLKSVHSVLAHLGYNSSPLIILQELPLFSWNGSFFSGLLQFSYDLSLDKQLS